MVCSTGSDKVLAGRWTYENRNTGGVVKGVRVESLRVILILQFLHTAHSHGRERYHRCGTANSNPSPPYLLHNGHSLWLHAVGAEEVVHFLFRCILRQLGDQHVAPITVHSVQIEHRVLLLFKGALFYSHAPCALQRAGHCISGNQHQRQRY